MARLAKAEQDAEASRAQRDAAIQKMKDAGRSIADIHRDLNIPVSTVRQSLRMAVIRAANR